MYKRQPHQLVDVWSDIEAIARALGCPSEGKALRTTLSHRLSDLAESTGMLTFAGRRPRVACIEWLDPIMIAGHWVPELVRLAGGVPILAKTGGPSVVVDRDALEAARPDVLVVQPCGFDLEATRREWAAHPLLAQAFATWRNAEHRPLRVALADGDAYFNRPGPRLVESAEVLAEILSPEPHPRPHEGEGWINLSHPG